MHMRPGRQRQSPANGRRAALAIALGAMALPRLWAADATAVPDAAPAADPSTRALTQRVQHLEAQVRSLQDAATAGTTHDGAPQASPASAATSPTMVFGAYGELKYGAQQNPDALGQWQDGFDGGRLTLLPSYQLSDDILFKAEIEFEHGGLSLDADDKLGGSLEIEQAYVDLTVNEHLHWRPPGIDVVPFGYTNLYHEPTLFYSVQRTELANGLIPTTWYEGATSIHGLVAGTVSYQLQVSTSLVDDGGNVRNTTAAHGPSAGGYPAGIDGQDGLALARATTSSFAQESNQVGVALRLSYSVPSLRGLEGSSSVYVTPNVEGRGTYATTASGTEVTTLGRCALIMVDSEARYRPRQTGIELRAEVVGVAFSNPGHLRANNDTDPTDNVGRTMWGFSVEAAYHVRCSHDVDVVPFYRYTREELQTAGVAGRDADAPDGSGRLHFHTVGLAVFPLPQLVLKLDAQLITDRQAGGARSDHVLGGVGFFF